MASTMTPAREGTRGAATINNAVQSVTGPWADQTGFTGFELFGCTIG